MREMHAYSRQVRLGDSHADSRLVRRKTRGYLHVLLHDTP